MQTGAFAGEMVGTVLKKLSQRVGHSACKFRQTPHVVELAAAMTEDAFIDVGAHLAAAFRTAAQYEGVGRVDFIGFITSEVAFGVYVRPGTSWIEQYSSAARESLLRTKIYRWLEKSLHTPTTMPAFPRDWHKRKWQELKEQDVQRASVAEANADREGVIVAGRLEFTPKGCQRWMKTPVRSESAVHSPIDADHLQEAHTPRDVMYRLQDPTPAIAALRFFPNEGHAWIKGAIAAQDYSFVPLLVAIFESAAAHGGRGFLAIVSPTDPAQRHVLIVNDGTAQLVEAAASPVALEQDDKYQQATTQFGVNLS
jgi:hypothetical protein